MISCTPQWSISRLKAFWFRIETLKNSTIVENYLSNAILWALLDPDTERKWMGDVHHETKNQCFGSRSAWIWLSWIRIRIGNADTDPAARNVFKKPWFLSFQNGFFWKCFKAYYLHKVNFSCRNPIFLWRQCLTKIRIRMEPHWFGSLIRICIEVKSWIRIRYRYIK